MRKLAILLLPVTAALDGLRITVTSKFASNTTTENSALDRLARAQRLRDDLTIDEKPTALGGWTVEVVARSTEYEKVEENDEGAARVLKTIPVSESLTVTLRVATFTLQSFGDGLASVSGR